MPPVGILRNENQAAGIDVLPGQLQVIAERVPFQRRCCCVTKLEDHQQPHSNCIGFLQHAGALPKCTNVGQVPAPAGDLPAKQDRACGKDRPGEPAQVQMQDPEKQPCQANDHSPQGSLHRRTLQRIE